MPIDERVWGQLQRSLQAFLAVLLLLHLLQIVFCPLSSFCVAHELIADNP